MCPLTGLFPRRIGVPVRRDRSRRIGRRPIIPAVWLEDARGTENLRVRADEPQEARSCDEREGGAS